MRKAPGARKVFVASVICLLAAACEKTPPPDLYLGEYILLEKGESGYILGDNNIAYNRLDRLPSKLKRYGSKKVLLGLGGEPTVGQLLTLGPVLAKGGYDIYYMNENGEPAQIPFVQVQ